MFKVWILDLYIKNEKKFEVYVVMVFNKFMYLYFDGLVVYSMRYQYFLNILNEFFVVCF